MTTNARDDKWSEWIEWNGGECPLPDGTSVHVKFRGSMDLHSDHPQWLSWWNFYGDRDIIAYRYKIKEPESDMHPDLEWLARNVSEWNGSALYVSRLKDSPAWSFHEPNMRYEFSKEKWLQARKDLGLIMSDEEEEMPAEEYKAKIGGPRKAENFLMQAADLMAERGKQYDQPGGERSMGKAVAALNAITGRDLTEAEGWLLMSLVKRVRQHSGAGYHQDSAEDAVAYAALEAEALESAV